MNSSTKIFVTLTALLLAPLAVIKAADAPKTAGKPNILWLVCEDAHVSWFGCYGNTHAKTPNIDQLGKEGFRYANAFASAPVCAASRTTMITGINGVSMGTHQMRSRYEIPHDLIKYYPDYLKQAGYLVENLNGPTLSFGKTDYNIGGRGDKDCWDNKDGKQNYCWLNKEFKTPFFRVINYKESHESKAFGDVNHTTHSPTDLNLAKYHPDLLDIRKNYALYYDHITKLDSQIGEALAKLKKSGHAEDTIVIFCSDHAGVMPRSKRFLFDSGTHAPLIIRIPEKYKALWPASAPGATIERLVSFLDFPKTWLSLAGATIPPVMQGHIFLGPQTEPEPEYVFSFRGRMDEGIDNQRSVRDHRYLYVKNYMPFTPWGQHLSYPSKMTATQAWVKAYQEGKCDAITGRFFQTKPSEELYDTIADPDNVNDLSQSAEYQKVLTTMRGKLREWQLSIHDAGLLPESECARRAQENKTTIYQMAQNSKLYDLPAYLDAADLALSGNPANRKQLLEWLKSPDSALRYWAATGFVVLKKSSPEEQSALKQVLNDPCSEVSALASWALILSGDVTSGQDNLNRLLLAPEASAKLFTVGVIEWMHPDSLAPYQAALQAQCDPASDKKKDRKNGGYTDASNTYVDDKCKNLLIEYHLVEDKKGKKIDIEDL